MIRTSRRLNAPGFTAVVRLGMITLCVLSASSVFSSPDLESDIHVIYLHGAIVEGNNPRPVHPKHGVYDYPAIVVALAELPAEVESEQRSASATVHHHAANLASRIEQLVDQGQPAARIAVVGHSKGGIIALEAASRLPPAIRREVRWAFLASCFPSQPSATQLPARSLSLRDASDRAAVSCTPRMTEGSREIEFATGRGHGLFYLPDPVWLEPLGEFLSP